ncbi:MAG: acyl-CoA thioesterase [Candidatus Kariarchaeaceae archaeon]|jgi:acyl-CoA thioester hydrolase
MIADIKKNYNPYKLQIQLRLRDTDSLGHLSNVSYIEYLETARTEWHTYTKNTRTVLDDGWDWILGEIRLKFKKEGYLSDKLNILMWCSRVGSKSWDFSYAIINGNDDIIAIAQTTQIAFNYSENTSQLIPDDILKDLKSRNGKSWEELS